jgi:hypothetical protein
MGVWGQGMQTSMSTGWYSSADTLRTEYLVRHHFIGSGTTACKRMLPHNVIGDWAATVSEYTREVCQLAYNRREHVFTVQQAMMLLPGCPDAEAGMCRTLFKIETLRKDSDSCKAEGLHRPHSAFVIRPRTSSSHLYPKASVLQSPCFLHLRPPRIPVGSLIDSLPITYQHCYSCPFRLLICTSNIWCNTNAIEVALFGSAARLARKLLPREYLLTGVQLVDSLVTGFWFSCLIHTADACVLCRIVFPAGRQPSRLAC